MQGLSEPPLKVWLHMWPISLSASLAHGSLRHTCQKLLNSDSNFMIRVALGC